MDYEDMLPCCNNSVTISATTISATNHIGHNHIGHKPHRPQSITILAISASLPAGTCPANLQNCRSSLRSSASNSYVIPRTRTRFAERAFSVAGPSPGTHCQLNLELLTALTPSSDDSRHTFLIWRF